MKFLFISLYLTMLFIPFTVQAKDCEEYNVRVVFDKKNILTKENLCLKKTSDNLIFYISKSCDLDKCEILKRKKRLLKIPNYLGNIGSPGFKLCLELGGIPQIFEYQKKNLSSPWQSAERCFFENDFVEISLLTSEWKHFINN